MFSRWGLALKFTLSMRGRRRRRRIVAIINRLLTGSIARIRTVVTELSFSLT